MSNNHFDTTFPAIVQYNTIFLAINWKLAVFHLCELQLIHYFNDEMKSFSAIKVFQCNGSIWAFSGEKFWTYDGAIGEASRKAVKATFNHAKKPSMKQTSK